MTGTRRAAAIAVVAATVAAGVLAAGAVPARADTGGHGLTLSVTLALASPVPGAQAEIARLAAAPARSDADVLARRAELRRLAPTAAQVAAVRSWASAHGLQVAGADSGWSVRVTGTDTALAGAFAVHLASARAADGSVLERPDAPLAVPAALRGSVSAATGLTNTIRHVSRARQASSTFTGYHGDDLRTAYSVPSTKRGEGLTVGTIQFAPLRMSDATDYAAREGIAYPPSKIGFYPTGDEALATESGSAQDPYEAEVALDVEAIMAMAPAADQLIFFSNYNNDSGASPNDIDLFDDLATAATKGEIQVASSSWGFCEIPLDDTADRRSGNASFDTYRAMSAAALDRFLAAGGTFFAASGDDGAYDCTGSYPEQYASELATDFPSSLSESVAVGGTRLPSAVANPDETAWSGSGGGYSAYGARPSYQDGTVANTHRGVPDVAADGDPATGFAVITEGSKHVYGGTSLASPLWAAMLAGSLSRAGRTTGLGDLHAVLYAHPSAFRDVTSGSNGYDAGAGWDAVTGLGAPVWSALDPVVTGLGTGGTFHEVTPFRLLDTRTSGTPVGTTTLTRQVAGVGAVPADATAVVANVTVTNPTSIGYVSVTPAGSNRPDLVSNVDFSRGQTVPNLVTSGLGGAAGSVQVYVAPAAANGRVDVVLDVFGYYTSDLAGAKYTSLAPVRVLDTRSGIGGRSTRLGPKDTYDLKVTGSNGVPDDAAAVVLNVTAANVSAGSFVSVRPTATTYGPLTSNLNTGPGVVIPNLVTVGVGTGGKVDLYNANGTVDLIADLQGYYSASQGALVFHPIAPRRVLDSRDGTGGLSGRLGQGGSYTQALGGFGGTGIPADAGAVLLNVTAVNQNRVTFVSVAPGLAPSTTTSNLNPRPGVIAANLVLTRLGDGDVTYYNSVGSVDVLADAAGYFSAE